MRDRGLATERLLQGREDLAQEADPTNAGNEQLAGITTEDRDRSAASDPRPRVTL
jgi:hypothetical protein